tara:strand:+ start:257 stop:571 length:315 start_codon:yes stop_codon:yes gene_type:complete
MYKTKNITRKQLQAVKITNQDEIETLTGSKLNPVQAWEVIKEASNGFKEKDPKAQEADALLFKIVYPEMKAQTTSKDTAETLRIQEKERARALALLELELQIAA